MKLYVPEIGDTFTLTKDWTFILHGENRNEALGEYFGHYLPSYNGPWVPSAVVPPMRATDYSVNYPEYNYNQSYDARQKAISDAEQACPEYVKYWDDFKLHREAYEKIAVKELKVTLKKGTVLSVDRIYIRKGASDYSSITFYAKNLGEMTRVSTGLYGNGKTKKVKAFRFWAKLSDCNNIEFSKD